MEHRAQPQQRKRVVEEGVTPRAEEMIVQEVEVTMNVSEEMQAVELFTGMVKKIDEMYQTALEMENSPQLAKLLGEIGVVKATLQESIGMAKESEERRVSEEALNARRDMERESDV